jgi:hypothetical protein
MATKKKVANAIASPFVFRKEWVFDEVPPWVLLNKAAISKIQQLKTQFVKEVNAAIVKGQQNRPS